MDSGRVTGSGGTSEAGAAQADPDVAAADTAAQEAARLARLAAEAAAEAARAQSAARAEELKAKAQDLATKAEAASKRAQAAAGRLDEKVEARFAKGQKVPPALQKAAERAGNLAKAAKTSATTARQSANQAATAVRNHAPRDRYVAHKDRQLDGAQTASKPAPTAQTASKPPPTAQTASKPPPADAARERYAALKDRQVAEPEERAGQQMRAQAGSLAQVYSAQPQKWAQVSRQMGLPAGTQPTAQTLERVLSSQIQGDIAAAAAQHRVRTSMGGVGRPGELITAEAQAMSLARLEAAHRNGVLDVPRGADPQVWMRGQAELAGATETVRQSAVHTGRNPERAVAESPVLFEMRLDVAIRSGEFPLGEGVTPEQVAAFKTSQVTNFKDAVRISGQRGIPLEDALSRVNDCRVLQQHRSATVDAINGMMDTYNANTTGVTRGLETIRGAVYQDGVNHLGWAHQEVKEIEALEARYIDLRMNHSAQELTPAQHEELRNLETEIHGRLNGLGENAQLHIDHSLRHANNSQWFEQALFSTVYTAAAFVPGGVALGAGTKLLLDDVPNGRIHNGMDAVGSLALGAGNVLVGKVAPGSGSAGSAVVRTVVAESAWGGASTFYEQARAGNVDATGIVASMAAGAVGGLLPGGGGAGNVAKSTWRTTVKEGLGDAATNFATGALVDGGVQLATTGRLDLGQSLAAGRDEALSSGLSPGMMGRGGHGGALPPHGQPSTVAGGASSGGVDLLGALNGAGAPPPHGQPSTVAGGASSGRLDVGNRGTPSVRRDLAQLLLEGDARIPVSDGGAQKALTLGEIADLPTESAFAIYHHPGEGTVRLQQVSQPGSTERSARVPLASYQQGARPGEVLLGGLHQHPGGGLPHDVPASSKDMNHDAALRAALGPGGDDLQMFILRRDEGRLVLTEFGGAPAGQSPAEMATRDAAVLKGVQGALQQLPGATQPGQKSLAALIRLRMGGPATSGSSGENVASLGQRVLTNEAGGAAYRLSYTAEHTDDGLVLRLDEKAGAVPAAALARDLKAFGLTPEVAGALASQLKSAPPGDCFWAGAQQVVHFGSGNDYSGSNIGVSNQVGQDFTQTNTGRYASAAKPPRLSATDGQVALQFRSGQDYASSNIAVFNVVGRDLVSVGGVRSHLNAAGRDIVALRMGPTAFTEQSVGQSAGRDIIDVRVKTDVSHPAIDAAASRLFDVVRSTPREHLQTSPSSKPGTGLVAGRDLVDLRVDLTGMSVPQAVQVLDAAAQDYVRRAGDKAPPQVQLALLEHRIGLQRSLDVMPRDLVRREVLLGQLEGRPPPGPESVLQSLRNHLELQLAKYSSLNAPVWKVAQLAVLNDELTPTPSLLREAMNRTAELQLAKYGSLYAPIDQVVQQKILDGTIDGSPESISRELRHTIELQEAKFGLWSPPYKSAQRRELTAPDFELHAFLESWGMEILPVDTLVGRVMSKQALIDSVLKPR